MAAALLLAAASLMPLGVQAQSPSAIAEWLALWSAGDSAAALAAGELLVKAADQPAPAVLLRAELAVHYSILGQFDRARQLIESATEWTTGWRFRSLPDGGRLGFDKRAAEARLARARCKLALAVQNLEEGQLPCEQALSRARRMVELTPFAPNPVTPVAQEVDALLDLARLQRGAGRYAAVRPLLDAAGALAQQHRLPMPTAAYFTRMAAYHAAEAGEPERAQALAEQAVTTLQAAGVAPTAAPLLQSRVLLHQVLVTNRNWPEAQRELDTIEAALQGQASGRMRPNLMAVALTAAHAGRLAGLQGPLNNATATWRTRLGSEHPLTAILQGLFGAALVASAQDGDTLARGRRQLAEASAVLLEAQRSGDPYLDGTMEAQAARFVLETFLRLQQQGVPMPGEFQLAFQVADVLRGSKVQAAMQDAALRMAGGSGGLGQLLRRDAELRGEIRGLEELLAGRTDSAADSARQRLAQLRVERQQSLQRVTSGFPAVAALLNPRVPTPEDVVRRLAVGELFVLLLPVDGGVHVWSLSWTEQQHRFLPLPAARLAQAVSAIRASTDFGDKLQPFALEDARWLGMQLLGPLQASLRQARHVVVAAGGALGTVPFAALPTGAAGDDGEPWLIRRAAVSQVPSASAWLAIQRLALTERPQGALMAWGDPVFDGRVAATATGTTRRVVTARSATLDTASLPKYSDLPALPETRDELLAIAASVKAEPARDLVLGAAATRASVLAANQRGDLATRRVVAFATHGLMAGDLPNLNQPALALAATPDAETNPLAPLLTLDDVLTLRLNADWVVLSACNTAAADGRAEEALSGLARGFFYAGARSVLVTHWAVETESAKLLTTRTFEHYTANPYAGKAESLRQAMLSVMAMPKYQHPAFWAPYALVGDGAR